jgi:hypothetical protein
MPECRLTLEFHPLEPVPGVWCDACLLPSVVQVPLLVVDARTLRVMGRTTWGHCQACGERRSSWDA